MSDVTAIHRAVFYSALCRLVRGLPEGFLQATYRRAPFRWARSYLEMFRRGRALPEGSHQATCRPAPSLPAMCRRPAYYQDRNLYSLHRPFLKVLYRMYCRT